MSSIVSVDRLNEAGAALRIFVLGGRALRLARLAIVEIISLARVFPDPVLVMEPDVEPDRAVESAVLIGAEPGQFVVKNLRRLRIGKIAIRHPAIGDRAGDAMDQLPNGCLAAAFVRVGPVGDVAVKIFRDRDFGRERAPAFRDLDVFLFKDHLGAVVGDFGGPAFPFHLVKRTDLRITENALKTQTALLFPSRFWSTRKRFAIFGESIGLKAGFELDHGGLVEGGSGFVNNGEFASEPGREHPVYNA